MQRLQKVMANAGIASRRKSEQLISSGKVTVNGEVVIELGTKVDPDVDEIKVNGKKINQQRKMYFLFNKPKGVITSMSDPQGRSVVKDYLKNIKERLYPIGRLDYDSEGLLLLTNDGDLALHLTHPSHRVPKTYLATVERVPHGTVLEKLAAGIKLEDGMTLPAELDYEDVDLVNKEATIRITIFEGRNRQIRRMFAAVHHRVIRLKRISYGNLQLGHLRRGQLRELTKKEVADLFREKAEPEQSH